jgi:hypothetical protein
MLNFAAAAAAGACLLIVSATGQATPVRAHAIAHAGSSQGAHVIQVRNRGRHWSGHHRSGRHWAGRHWRHRYWNHWGYYDNDYGGALAAGAIFGLAAGALAANAAAGSNAVAYCERRFRSYDPASGTYLGYDGYRHPCP